MQEVHRVVATETALELIRVLENKHGALMFHQSGGCCDGSSPMCYPRGEFLVGEHDVLLGTIGGHPFYISAAQYEYWKHTQLMIDVVEGRGGMFSLEGPEGRRFLTRSRLFTDEEWAAMAEEGTQAATACRAPALLTCPCAQQLRSGAPGNIDAAEPWVWEHASEMNSCHFLRQPFRSTDTASPIHPGHIELPPTGRISFAHPMARWLQKPDPSDRLTRHSRRN